MPNWCQNSVDIYCKDSTIIDRIEQSAATGVLNELLPIPQDLKDTPEVWFADEAKQQETNQRRAANAEKYGYYTWYDWCIGNWGTKWDLCDCTATRNNSNNITLSFDTAWSPPVEAYQTLWEMGIEVDAYFYEPGMAFAGTWFNGQETYYQDLSNSDAAQAQLPQDLIDRFNIVESMREWEEQEEEE